MKTPKITKFKIYTIYCCCPLVAMGLCYNYNSALMCVKTKYPQKEPK